MWFFGICDKCLNNNVLLPWVHREYEEEALGRSSMMPFTTWLRSKCSILRNETGSAREELMALSKTPSRQACSFKSMTSFGCHYRVDAEETGSQHVTFDSGVAELEARRSRGQIHHNSIVELVRVGILKDIVILNYGSLNVVLMVVSWVAEDSEGQPRLRRDSHGFWIANMAARPRDTSNPYLLPARASQVQITYTYHNSPCFDIKRACIPCNVLNMHSATCRYSLWMTKQHQDGVSFSKMKLGAGESPRQRRITILGKKSPKLKGRHYRKWGQNEWSKETPILLWMQQRGNKMAGGGGSTKRGNHQALWQSEERECGVVEPPCMLGSTR